MWYFHTCEIFQEMICIFYDGIYSFTKASVVYTNRPILYQEILLKKKINIKGDPTCILWKKHTQKPSIHLTTMHCCFLQRLSPVGFGRSCSILWQPTPLWTAACTEDLICLSTAQAVFCWSCCCADYADTQRLFLCSPAFSALHWNTSPVFGSCGNGVSAGGITAGIPTM